MQPRDNVFQLSLTEIAFIIICLLLFLLGSMLMTRDKQLKDQAEVIKIIETVKEKNKDLREYVTELAEAARSRDALEELKQQVADLDEQIQTLEKIREILATPSPEETAKSLMDESKGEDKPPPSPEPVSDEQLVEQVEQMKKQAQADKAFIENLLEQAQGEDRESLPQVLAALNEAGGDVKALAKKNADLIEQVSFLSRTSGFGFPPCFPKPGNSMDYLVEVELYEDYLTIERRWPAARQAEAAAIPNINMVDMQRMTYAQFRVFGQSVLDHSKAQRPECRHYAIIDNRVENASTAQNRRLIVENYMYKLERVR